MTFLILTLSFLEASWLSNFGLIFKNNLISNKVLTRLFSLFHKSKAFLPPKNCFNITDNTKGHVSLTRLGPMSGPICRLKVLLQSQKFWLKILSPDLSPNVMDQRYPLYDGSCNNRIVPGRGQAYQIGCINKNDA